MTDLIKDDKQSITYQPDPALIEELRAIDTETLKRQLAENLTITAQYLARAAAVWKVLDERGEDLSHLRVGLASYLRQIAEGTLDPHLIIGYAGQRMLLGAAAKMPIDAQRALAECGTVPYVSLNADGARHEIQKQLNRLTVTDIQRIFSNGRIRGADEQFLQLSKLRERKPRRGKGAPGVRRSVKISQNGETIQVGGVTVNIERVLDALSEFYGTDIHALIARGMG